MRGRQRREDVDAPGRIGRDAEQIVEHIDQQQARNEGRHADAERAKQPHAMVDERARPQRRQHAERDRRYQRDQQRGQREFKRGRQAIAQILRDRPGRSSASGRDCRGRHRRDTAAIARGTGLSSPICLRMTSISSLPAFGPEAKNTAGSPGSTRISRKVKTSTPNSAGREDMKRLPARTIVAPKLFIAGVFS